MLEEEWVVMGTQICWDILSRNDADQLLGGPPLGPGFDPLAGRVRPMILALNERCMELEQSRGLQDYGVSDHPPSTQEQRYKAGRRGAHWRERQATSSCYFNSRFSSMIALGAARFHKLCSHHQQVCKQDETFSHGSVA